MDGNDLVKHNQMDQALNMSRASRQPNFQSNTLKLWANKGIMVSCRITPRGEHGLISRDIDQFLTAMLSKPRWQ
jgi:hypothetical protein